MKVKAPARNANVEVPLDPVLFAASVPSRKPTLKDLADAKERPDDAIEPKDHATMGDMVRDLGPTDARFASSASSRICPPK